MPRVLAVLGVSLAIVLFIATLPGRSAATGEVRATSPPNVIVIVVDDQPMGLMDAMPQTTELIVDQGLTLTEGFIPTSWCCPSRASLLTGNYAHTTGVYTLGYGTLARLGGWPVFHEGAENQTVATELDAAGYRTGFFGKYLNGYAKGHPEGYTPPGWDRFVSFNPDFARDAAYYDYWLEGTIDPVHFGNAPADYSTDVLAGYASRFVANAPSDRPFLLYFSPFGVHSPHIPASRHKGLWPLEPRSSIPALNEQDLSDKPPWVQDNPLVDAVQQRTDLTLQHETAMSVDDAVAHLMSALGGRVENTLIVYLSDNGYMLGSHRITGKNVPYKLSTEVPMFLRWDGVLPAGTVSNRATPNVDLTATIAEATGTIWPMEGLSILSQERAGTLLEQVRSSGHPAYCGWRTEDYLFVEYADHSQEFYDYTRDPNELHNAVDRARNAQVVDRLRAAAKAACLPMPPGFSWG